MRPLLDALRDELGRRESALLLRRLQTPAGIDFCSNDYLGLASHPGLRAKLRAALDDRDSPLTAPASRHLRGTTPAHLRLERRLARFKGTEAALLFPSGYQANLALVSTLVGLRDRVLSDALNHASLIDAIRLSGASRVIFPHLDVAAVEEALASAHPGGRTFLVTESLFSMDGDVAPLRRYADLAEARGASLLVDDAHATGLFGAERASGLVEEAGVAGRVAGVVSTLGKALGVGGAFVAGPRIVVDTLVDRARPFLYSTAPPPLLAAAVEAALDLAEEEPWRRRRALDLAGRLRGRLREAGLRVPEGPSPIVPVVLGDNRRALEVASALRARGFDVRAIRPPTVPEGTARLRLSVHADHDEAAVDGLAAALTEIAAGREAGVTGAPRA